MKEILLFSYGSNSTKQIKDRLSITEDLIPYPSYIADHIRIFAGFSKKWKGGVASLYPSINKKTYGIIVKLTEDQLHSLSKFEKGYHLEIKKIMLNKTEIDCYVYIKDDINFIKPPSKLYIDAINCTLDERQNNPNRKILIKYVKNNNVYML
jgi:hypothetical protein